MVRSTRSFTRSETPRIVLSDVPGAFEPLLAPSRYKGAYGGRGGAKSHFFAERLLMRCLERPTRAVGIREYQRSLKDSVYQLLKDKIASLAVGDRFDVMDNEIRPKNGGLIIFRGMQSYNAESIKSLEGYDIAWTEEAQTLSEKSLNMLKPTLRKEDSELWFSWNPRYRTDPVDRLFRKHPPPGTVSVNVSWRDNPWFPQVLRTEMEHDKEVDPEQAEHVWEGAYGVDKGSILGPWVTKAESDGRIHDSVTYDPDGAPVEISSDIGFRDTASWWFWQRKVGGFSLLKYLGDSGLDAGEWIDVLKNELNSHEWKLGKIHLPHDAKAKTFQTKHSVIEQFAMGFGNRYVAIVPQTKKKDRINAARTVIRNCEFHKTRCADGLDGLEAWQFTFNEELQTHSREPLHNWASHPSDAFSYGCQVMTEAVVPSEPPVIALPEGWSIGPDGGCQVTLEQAWEWEKRRKKLGPEWV